MAQLERAFQTFKSEDGAQLTSLQCHVCEETGEQYVLWRDIQQAFEGVGFLEHSYEFIVLFEADNEGGLRLPLRLKHMPNEECVVVYSGHRLLQSMGSQHIHQEHSGSHSINTPDNNEFEGHTQNQTDDNSIPHLEKMYEYCTQLYQILDRPHISRMAFLRYAANARLYHSMLMEEMERLNWSGLSVQVDGKHQSQILEELGDLEKQVPGWDYRSICRTTLDMMRVELDYVPPTLYIVLPSDLNSWIDMDPSTHQFRLYFLCDNLRAYGPQVDMHQHVHLCNHPGYIIKRPQEFLQVYGDYSLRILRMVKHGYSDNRYNIPSLETFEILWNCDPDIVSNRLTRDTLGPLVDKAIAHLQEMSLPTRNSELSLLHKESDVIKTFLEVQEEDNAEGNLCRHISGDVTHWICQPHVNQRFNQAAMKDLKEFVFGRRGHIDLRHSTLKVELGSQVEADQFLMLLTSTKRGFDISMKLDWKASRSYVRELCLGIAKTGTPTLEIDGISLDIIPQGRVQYTSDLFSEELISDYRLQIITLLNYPQPQERCLHFKYCSLQSTLPSIHLTYSWVEIRNDLDKFRRLMSEVQAESDLNTAVAELKAVLGKHGMSEVIAVTINNGDWDAVIDMEKMAFVEVSLVDAACPRAVLTSGSLLRLTIDYLNDGTSQQEYFDMVQPNTGLKELNISYYGHDVQHYIDHVVKIWHQSSSSVCLSLLNRMDDTQGRMVAQMARSRGDSESPGNSRLNVLEAGADPTLGQEQKVLDDLADTKFMYWDCDHISSPLSDYSAAFLDMATQQHPSVLVLLTLDISQVSRVGLSSVRNILGRSSLEHLHILCTPFNPTMSESIAEVLGSVQWLTLKSLVLSGNNIDEWIRHWPLPIVAPQLMHLQIQGTGSTMQELSHSSALFLHELVHTSPLQEFHFKNMVMKEKRDWELIRAEEVEP